MAVDVEELRRGLRDHRTRSATIDRALDYRAEHIEPTIELLSDRNEPVRWSAIRILSEIGDERAIEPLIGLVERGRNATDAANALRAITGQDFGDDAAEWRRWRSGGSDTPIEQKTAILSDDDLLAEAARDLPIVVDGGEQRYTATVSLAGGRSQRVWIDFSRKDPEGRPIVQLATPCGVSDPARYEWALKLNMSIPYGAVALALLGKSLCFAMVDTHLRATVDPQDIATSVMTLARQGDSIEKALASEDRY